MKYVVYAVRDLAAQCFNPPFFVRGQGAAQRGFADAVNDPNHPMGQHPEDYELCKLGTFDDGSGVFEVGIPEPVCVGKSLVRAAVPRVSDASSAPLK